MSGSSTVRRRNLLPACGAPLEGQPSRGAAGALDARWQQRSYEVAIETILEVIIALLIAVPLGLFVIFDLPGLGIVLAIGLISFAYVMKKNHEEILAGLSAVDRGPYGASQEAA